MFISSLLLHTFTTPLSCVSSFFYEHCLHLLFFPSRLCYSHTSAFSLVHTRLLPSLIPIHRHPSLLLHTRRHPSSLLTRLHPPPLLSTCLHSSPLLHTRLSSLLRHLSSTHPHRLSSTPLRNLAISRLAYFPGAAWTCHLFPSDIFHFPGRAPERPIKWVVNSAKSGILRGRDPLAHLQVGAVGRNQIMRLIGAYGCSTAPKVGLSTIVNPQTCNVSQLPTKKETFKWTFGGGHRTPGPRNPAVLPKFRTQEFPPFCLRSRDKLSYNRVNTHHPQENWVKSVKMED